MTTNVAGISALVFSVIAFLSASCVTESMSDSTVHSSDALASKADGALDCAEHEIILILNDSSVTVDLLRELGVHSQASKHLIDYRNGDDDQIATPDDLFFSSIRDVDEVPYVGPVALEQLLAIGHARCMSSSIDVVFSPKPWPESHLATMVTLIAAAEHSIDVAMYSFRDSAILSALEDAVYRGVQVRFIFNSALADQRDPEGSRSAALEEVGIDVRYVNKIMHHKMTIIDGAVNDLQHADTGVLVTGSANWSYSAGTRYDENTLIAVGDRTLNLLFQREFNHLWRHSRDFVWGDAFDHVLGMEIAVDEIPVREDTKVFMTSDNFSTYKSERYGETFSVDPDLNTVADALVELILGAKSRIWIASGHLRSRPISEALLWKATTQPEVDIRVYLDGQEYISRSGQDYQDAKLASCLEAAAEHEAKVRDCMNKGYRWSLTIHEADIPVRFKYYAYRWEHSYAEHMHHKYMLIDGETLATGSYNYSDNAEHATMENLVVLKGSRHEEIVDRFEENFLEIWNTGRLNDEYAAFMTDLDSGTEAVQLVFDPMALTWDEINPLKEAIRDACPEVDSDAFRDNPAAHRFCDR